ncbi:protein phosphatase 1 regulatory subunit 3C-like [Spea bombifrons]|uniref:protein phosphatase 1 regulatory subunit 3C-like n=1 Tax=Spea bombifrons TaxID=233779 RepID=UPI00234BCFFE|nr:protein phosphatase 1 regulatory subunit 3C-like [Spea bombifrons]
MPAGDFSILCLSPLGSHQLRRSPSGVLRPCLTQTPRPPDPRKKGVVFADALGLALTSICHFSPSLLEEDHLGLALASLRALRTLSSTAYTLDFRPPSQDYADFRSRLAQQQVCLEQCAVQGAAVVGTVRVRNLGYEKRVTLRVSYDKWNSHFDLPCSYLHDPHGGATTDSFSFRLPLPLGTEQAEFCLCFWCQGQEFWDNNHGTNYALHKAAEGSGYMQRTMW